MEVNLAVLEDLFEHFSSLPFDGTNRSTKGVENTRVHLSDRHCRRQGVGRAGHGDGNDRSEEDGRHARLAPSRLSSAKPATPMSRTSPGADEQIDPLKFSRHLTADRRL